MSAWCAALREFKSFALDTPVKVFDWTHGLHLSMFCSRRQAMDREYLKGQGLEPFMQFVLPQLQIQVPNSTLCGGS